MGYYIDPTNCSKEDFLAKYGKRIAEPSAFDWSRNTLPVCLVDNGLFTAAGIAFDRAEAGYFMRLNGRLKQWFEVSREDLKPYYPG